MQKLLRFIKECHGFVFFVGLAGRGQIGRLKGLMEEEACETGSKQILVEDDIEQHPHSRAWMTDVAQALGFMWESNHRTNRIKLNTSDSLGPAINILSEHFSKGLRAQEYCKYNGNLSIYVNVTLYVSKNNMIFDI